MNDQEWLERVKRYVSDYGRIEINYLDFPVYYNNTMAFYNREMELKGWTCVYKTVRGHSSLDAKAYLFWVKNEDVDKVKL